MAHNESATQKGGKYTLHNVYVIIDGVVVFHRVYGSIDKDPALVSSFIGAVASLSREITDYGILKTIEIPPIKIDAMQVMDSPQVLIATATSQDFPAFAVSKILTNIAEVFLNRFADKITTLGTRDLTDMIKDDVHKAILAGINEASSPFDPSDKDHRIRALLKNYTSPNYSCPHYDLKVNSKCKLEPNVYRVADCQGVAFNKGFPCSFVAARDEVRNGEIAKQGKNRSK